MANENSIEIPIVGNSGPLLKTIAGLGTAIAGALALNKAIDIANEFDEALNSMNIALAASGTFSAEASAAFQAYAQSIQETTKFGDEQVLSTVALLGQMTSLSNDGLKVATQAALDLSAAYKIDLETATRMVGKAADGNVDSFKRLGIEVQKGSTDAETYSNALRALAGTQGAAAKSANTYEGAMARLGNGFNDVMKNFGFLVTRSPAIIAAVNEVTKVLSGISKGIGGNTTDFAKEFIINLSLVAQAGLQTAKNIGDSFVLAFLRSEQAWAAFKVLTTAGFSDTYNKQLMEINTQIDALKAQWGEDAGAVQFFDTLISKVQETSGALNTLNEGVKNSPITVAAPTWGMAIDAFKSQFQMSTAAVGLSTEALAQRNAEASATITADFQKMGLAARNAMGGAMGSAFAAFGKALASGENAMKAFGKAFLGAIGQAAIQEGTSMIMRGIGYSLDPFMAGFGPPLIQAGAALAAFGGALSAVGGGGGAAGGGGGGGGAAAAPASSADVSGEDVTQLEPQKPQTAITVQVQGNILDRRQTGLEIAEVIQETFGTNGVVFNT